MLVLDGKIERYFSIYVGLMSGFCEKVKLIVYVYNNNFLRSTTEWTFFFFSSLHYLTWDWYVDDDSDDLHQLWWRILLIPLWPLSNLIGFDDVSVTVVSWHPFWWKLMIKSQTDGGEGLVGGGKMYNICLNLFSSYYLY